MSLGSDYASGYNLGLRETDQESAYATNAANILRSRQPMSGMNYLSGGKSARQIRDEAAEQALKIREGELANKEAELRMAQLQSQEQRDAQKWALEKKQGEDKLYGTQRARGIEDIEAAETRSTAARGIIESDTERQKAELLENAMRGFYTGDSEAVKTYFDVYGKQGIGIEAVTKDADGGVTVDFGEGKTQKFATPKEAIEKLLIPAATIMSQKNQLNTKQLTDYVQDAIKQCSEDKKNGVIDKNYPTEKYVKEYLATIGVADQTGGLGVTGGGATGEPGTGGTGGTATGLNEAPPVTETAEKKVVRTQRNKKTGAIKETMEDGSVKIRMPIGQRPAAQAEGGPKENYVEYKDASTGEKRRKAVVNGKIVEYRRDEATGAWVEAGAKATGLKEG